VAEPRAPRITIDGVRLALPGPDGAEVRVLGGITVEIEPSEFVCLLGPSGCGKTTLLNCIAGFLRPSAGTILIDSAPITGTPPEVGIVFQEHALFPWFSVQQNVEYGLRVQGVPRPERKRVARDFIELVGLTGFEHHYPHQLSGGMKQRVGIARTLVNRPSVLLMDEPFGALDAMTREAMQEELLRVWERDRKTVVFVTHSIAEAVFLSGRVVVMSPRPGRITKVVDIGLPRPRTFETREDPRFFAAVTDVRESLREAYGA
jgi:NitT/TauT family transport system ATP-binding protein